nr:histone-lysine N-methyltransferase SETD1A-like [Ipomoea batatas]
MEFPQMLTILIARLFLHPRLSVLDLEQSPGAVRERSFAGGNFAHFSAVGIEVIGFSLEENRAIGVSVEEKIWVGGGHFDAVFLFESQNREMLVGNGDKCVGIAEELSDGVHFSSAAIFAAFQSGSYEEIIVNNGRHLLVLREHVHGFFPHDAKAGAAAAFDRPEEVIPHGFPVQNSAFHVHNPRVQNMVGAQPVLADHVAVPPAGDVSADADGGANPGRESQNRALLGNPIKHVQNNKRHSRDVREPLIIMPAAPYFDLNFRFLGAQNHRGDVTFLRGGDDDCGLASFGKHKRPKKSRSLDDAAVKVSAEEYEYEIFRSPEEYQKANLEPPRYDLPEKYTPQRAAVTLAVRPPLPEAGSRGTMRSFPVSARPPAPAKKISLGSKKAEPAKTTDPSPEALVPTGLPLATTHPSSLSGDHGEARNTKRGKEKETEVEEVAPAKRSRRDGSGSTTPVIDVLMKHGDEPPAALLSRICAAAPPPEKTSGWSTALVGERIACDLIQISSPGLKMGTKSTVEKWRPSKKVRRPVGEDLMYEFGTWAFNSGRKAMQNDVRTALEVAMDEADLPNILAILPEEVPDPGPTPFSSVPEGRNLLVPVVEVSAGPSAEVAATAGPTTELGATLSAGPLAEGDAEPGGEPPKKAD